MRKKITIYFSSIDTEIEIPDNVDQYDIEMTISNKLHDNEEKIKKLTEIDFFEIYKDNEEQIISKEKEIEELTERIYQLEKNQNEIIALGGDDLHIREEIWELEERIDELLS